MNTATATETTRMPLINETAPDFTAETTQGTIRFHEWIGNGCLREGHMLKQLWRTDAPLTYTGLLMLPALAVAIAGLLLDPRIITDAPAWLKPAKFVVSIAIYVFTLAWAFTLIPGWRNTRRVVGWATAITMVLEFAIIALQAYRGTTSHFNFSTPLNSVLFVIMGVAIVAQTFISIAVAIAFWRQNFEDLRWDGPFDSG